MENFNINDETVRRNNERILSQFRRKPQQESATEQVIALPYLPEPKPEKTDSGLSQQAKEFLMYNSLNLWKSLVEKYKDRDLSLGTGSRMTESLIRKEAVIPWDIRMTPKGRATRFLEITAKGYSILNIPPHTYGRGSGFCHYCHQVLIARHLKNLPNVSKVEIEGSVEGKCVDVLVRAGKIIAIEVAMDSVNECNNLTKDLQAGCDFVLIVCKDIKVLQDVKNILASVDPEGKKASATLLPQVLKCKSIEELLEVI